MTVKVSYDNETTKVTGYYPDTISYLSIPEPFIEISDEDHQANLDKEMAVVDGVFQEYEDTDEEILAEAKAIRINSRNFYLNDTLSDVVLAFETTGSKDDIDTIIASKRSQARSEIALIEAATSIEDLSEISEDFL